MDNNNFNQNDHIDEPYFIHEQQVDRRRRDTPFDIPDFRGEPPSAPPSFTPDMPRTGGQPFSGDFDSIEQFRGPERDQFRSLRRCLNRFTFIWLVNGNSFWFYPTFIRRQQVEGFRWRNGRWEFDRINIRRILFFRCFR